MPAPPAAPVPLALAFINEMNALKGVAQPWGLPPWMLDVLNDFYGAVVVFVGVCFGAPPRCTTNDCDFSTVLPDVHAHAPTLYNRS